MGRIATVCLVVLSLLSGRRLRADQEDLDRLPSIISTEDVIDWTLNWTGSEFYPSEYGPAGWPGKDDELKGAPGYRDVNWGWPEVVPYPGSIEHVRYNFQRYLPVYPIHNKNTLVKRFLGSETPGVDPERIVSYAEPVYHVPKYLYLSPTKGIWSDALKLGKYRAPIKALRFDSTHEALSFELGVLRPSAYVVRIIAATESELVEHATKRLVIKLSINDGPKGEVNTYQRRNTCNDQFYSICELFVMAPEARNYSMDVWVDASSELPLYLYAVDIHDRLRQLPNRTGKTSPSYYKPEERQAAWEALGPIEKDTRGAEERFADDELLWKSMPGMNAQPRGNMPEWNTVTRAFLRLPQDKKDDGMGIDLYGSDMIWNIPEKEYAGHPAESLFRSAGLLGLYYNLQRQSYFGEAEKVQKQITAVRRWNKYNRSPGARDYDRFVKKGSEIGARNSAVRLAMVALMNIFEMDAMRHSMVGIDYIPFIYNQMPQDRALRRRAREGKGSPAADLMAYDQLFPYIKGNEDLAQSLGRFIPWIMNAGDLQRFYEVGLVQLPAHEILTYQRYNSHSTGEFLSPCIVVQQDAKITRPWMEYLFRYLWEYPQIPMGVDETFFNCKNRDGTSTIGSTFYAFASIGSIRTVVRDLKLLNPENYKGIIEEDITVPEAHIRAEMEARFNKDSLFAGGHRIAVGDVSGACPPRWWLNKEAATDPRNRSRVLSDWFGALETEVEQEDFRKRSAVALRVGCGYGHAHNDPLDLQLWSLGVPLCGDWGGRGGYAIPSSLRLETHNTVVNAEPLLSGDHRWIASLSDTTGSRYMMGIADSKGFYGRQVALVDMDDASAGVYVVDVFRLQGDNGDKIPVYAFHGPPPDDFFTNIDDVRKGYPEGDGPLFDPDHNWHGVISSHLIADWRLQRGEQTVEWTPAPKQKKSGTWIGKPGVKQSMVIPDQEGKVLGKDFNPADPRKHIHMHLLGHEGAMAYGKRGYMLHAWKFVNDMLFVRPRTWEGETVFPVVFEPYGEETRIRDMRLLTDNAGLDKHTSPVAIEIRLKNGRRDIVCMAPRDSEAYTVPGVGTVQGEYAFLSYDGKGLRQATLSGGTRIKTDALDLSSPRAAHEATVMSLNPTQRSIELDAPMPPECVGAVVEIGNRTSYAVATVESNRITTVKDFVAGMSRIKGFLEDGNPYSNAALALAPGLAVSTGDLSKWWTVGQLYDLKPEEKAWWNGGDAHPAEIPPRGRGVPLTGGPKPSENMKPGARLWLYEFAAGARVRLPVRVNLMRQEDDSYKVCANIAASVSLKGTQLSVDRGGFLEKPGRPAPAISQAEEAPPPADTAEVVEDEAP